MEQPITVTYKSTNSAYEANQFLQELSTADTIACDFEAAIKYTEEELEAFKEEIETCTNKKRWQQLNSIINATALDHPSHVQLTHCSIAANDHEGYVFILDNKQITNRILNFLITTEQQQIWHNASYDFKHIYYYTRQMPKFYEDTQVLAKTVLNHSDTQQALSGLKHLVGHRYGAWGISADNFTLDQMYDPKMLLYAATDACATYYLWNSIQRYLDDENSSTV